MAVTEVTGLNHDDINSYAFTLIDDCLITYVQAIDSSQNLLKVIKQLRANIRMTI